MVRAEPSRVRRLLVVLLAASFGLPLLAAGPSSILTNKPVVMVFPFTPNGSSIDREAVASLAASATVLICALWLKTTIPVLVLTTCSTSDAPLPSGEMKPAT